MKRQQQIAGRDLEGALEFGTPGCGRACGCPRSPEIRLSATLQEGSLTVCRDTCFQERALEKDWPRGEGGAGQGDGCTKAVNRRSDGEHV